jgi:hypothetical protein
MDYQVIIDNGRNHMGETNLATIEVCNEDTEWLEVFSKKLIKTKDLQPKTNVKKPNIEGGHLIVIKIIPMLVRW